MRFTGNSWAVSSVDKAYNIEQAKKILLSKNIDLVISDVEMPMGSGLDLLRWFREQEMEGEFLLLTCHEDFQLCFRSASQSGSRVSFEAF